MSKTRAQIVQMVGEELLIASAGNSLADEDADKIDGRFDGLVAELAARGVVDIPDEAEIADELSGPLAVCLAFECSPTFGLQKDAGAREDAESRMRVIAQRIDPPSRTLKADTMLQGSGGVLTMARWTRGV